MDSVSLVAANGPAAPTGPNQARRCLVSVHAHPDDEASKGPATVAHYASIGVRCVLVCCTGGEEGDILNPAMDRPEVRSRLAEVRREELAKAAAIIGYSEVIWLGYRDSGMAGCTTNDNPACFARADTAAATGRLVEILRRERPQVVIIYADDQEGYPHPDHLRVHEIGLAAYEACGDPSAFAQAGPLWMPAKLYYSAWNRASYRAMHQRFIEAGLESPFSEDWLGRSGLDDRVTTAITVAEGNHIRRAALRAHATQIDPASPFWFADPPGRNLDSTDHYILARSAVGPVSGERLEQDLFAGI